MGCLFGIVTWTIASLQVNLSRGYGYVEFKTRGDAEKAQAYMDGVSLIETWCYLFCCNKGIFM